MSRLDMITIGIVVICLAALGYLVYKIVNLMNPPADTLAITDTYEGTDAIDDSTYVADDWDGEVDDSDATADLDDDELNYDTTDDEDYTGDAGGFADEDEDVDESGGSELDSSSGSSGSSSSGSSAATASSGRYMVVAGSYQQRVNADNQERKLKRLGYSSTEVSLFDRGSYALVIVDRFSRFSEAQALVRKLSGDGVEAYVKAKR